MVGKKIRNSPISFKYNFKKQLKQRCQSIFLHFLKHNQKYIKPQENQKYDG